MKIMLAAALFAIMPAAATVAQIYVPPATSGYWEGPNSFYPYDGVYCDRDTGLRSACYGALGSMLSLPESAPLPKGRHWCEWVDDSQAWQRIGKTDWATMSGTGWYQWRPRPMPDALRPYTNDLWICYLKDRGKPKSANQMKRD